MGKSGVAAVEQRKLDAFRLAIEAYRKTDLLKKRSGKPLRLCGADQKIKAAQDLEFKKNVRLAKAALAKCSKLLAKCQ